MKIYPRHKLDIKIIDIIIGLFSYSFLLRKKTIETEILSYWNEKTFKKISFTVRTSLDSILTALNLPVGSEVIMSAINIQDMLNIVENHKLKVITVDINIEDLSINLKEFESLISKETKVVIIAHLFGAIVDLKQIYELCKKNGTILIEDCAQGFCGKKYQGSPYSDFTLFSFGPIKSTTSLGGAIIVARSFDLIERVEKIENRYSKKSEIWFFKRLIKYLILKILSQPVIYGLLIKFLTIKKLNIEIFINGLSRSFPKDNLISEIRYKPPIHLLFLLRRRLKKKLNQHFNTRIQFANELINNLSNLKIPSIGAKYHSFWLVPVLSDNSEKLKKELIINGFDTTRANHSQTVIKPSDDNFSYEATNAKYVLDRVLFIPNTKNMDKKDKEKLISILNYKA